MKRTTAWICVVMMTVYWNSFLGAQVPRIKPLVDHLTCEYWSEPLNVDVPQPRLSWIIRSEARGARQSAYQVLVASNLSKLQADSGDLWDSGKVESDRTIGVEYKGSPLHSGQSCYWKIRIWDESQQASDWSQSASWAMGPLTSEDWHAKWITTLGSANAADDHLGYHAAVTQNPEDAKWVQVDLGRSTRIDLIKLHSMDHETKGFGFPIRFKILVSDDPEFKTSDCIHDSTTSDFPNPGDTAVSFEVNGIVRRYVRVLATRLFRRSAGDQSCCFALSQLQVFSSGKDVALHAAVTALDSTEAYGWSRAQLTDGKGLAPDANVGEKTIRTMPVFQKTFQINKAVHRATLHICGLGQYEASLNNKKIGDSVLDPGWTNYRKTCLYCSYDLTNRVLQGSNQLRVMLGNGMYNVVGTPGRYTKFTGSFGPPMLIAQLDLVYSDGTTQSIATDNTWQVRGGPITFSSIYGGEDYDARLELSSSASANSDAWQPVVITEGPGGTLCGVSRSAPPIIVAQKLKPRQVTALPDGTWVYDLGQNCAQIPLLTVRGSSGQSVRLTPSELLKPNGDVSQQSCGGPTFYTYTLKGEGVETWSPRFSYSGCRYFSVSAAVPAGAPNPKNLPVIDDFEGSFITSSSPIAGSFSCSNPLFNRTSELIVRAMRNNLMSVLTDCPHRERLGWLEQTHLVGPSLMYNIATPALLTKVCGDISDAQTSDGLVPDIAPEYAVFGGGFRDSPEWGSAALLIPWQMHKWYGDDQVLARQYETMKRYVEYLHSKAKNSILDGGLGDWYDLGPKPPGYSQLTPVSFTATAFYFQDARILAKTAELLGHAQDAEHYSSLATQVSDDLKSFFYHANTHNYATGSQTANAIALVFGLVPPPDRPAVLQHIVDDIRDRHNGLTAGDIGYHYLLEALAEGGRSDVIFDMNSRTEGPGYGMMIAKGATSLTEAWDARPDSSQDHFMLGHIMSWFYGNLAGIQFDHSTPGFKKIVINPEPVGDLTWASASYESIRGTIRSKWTIADNTFHLDITIPPNCSAVVNFPEAYSNDVSQDGRPISATADTRPAQHITSIAVESGSFHFDAKRK